MEPCPRQADGKLAECPVGLYIFMSHRRAQNDRTVADGPGPNRFSRFHRLRRVMTSKKRFVSVTKVKGLHAAVRSGGLQCKLPPVSVLDDHSESSPELQKYCESKSARCEFQTRRRLTDSICVQSLFLLRQIAFVQTVWRLTIEIA